MFNNYKKISCKIEKSTLSKNNKSLLKDINVLLYNLKGKEKIEFPLLIVVKDLDNIDITFIEKTISEMLKTYRVFEGKLLDTNKFYSRIRWLSKMTDKKAYKYELDRLVLLNDELKNYFDIIEKLIDTNNSLLLLECLIHIDNEFYKHGIYNKCDFIFEGDTSLNNIINTMLLRYEENGIDCDLDLKKLNEIIKHNLGAKVFDTDELCMQYMYNKSLKSYIKNKRKKLIIEDIPIYEDIDEIIDQLNEESEVNDDIQYNEIVEFITAREELSISLLQRTFNLGYNHANKIVELLEKRGIIIIRNDSNSKKVLINKNR
jgi:DNA segregation ATPase FtsK/SpoIIIE and related proteins